MRTPALQRGISLVEALVALAVMAFGMLAIVGIQSTMRLNADVAKQRSEATRIAQEAIERWRAYSVLDTAAGRTAYADIATAEDTQVEGYTTNTTYTLARTVVEPGGQTHKVLRVIVRWTDRADSLQQVMLDTVISKSDPAAFAALATPPVGNPSKRPRGRHAAIPVQAQDMGNGKSVFRPPQGGGGSAAWVFDNVSGMITGLCDIAPSTTFFEPSDIEACANNTLAHMLSGFVSFARATPAPDAAEAEHPSGRPRRLRIELGLTTPNAFWNPFPVPPEGPGPGTEYNCYDDSPQTLSAAISGNAVAYYCWIRANPKKAWSGYSTVVPLPFTDDPDSAWTVPTSGAPVATHRQCRYTPATSDTQVVPNSQHPKRYRILYLDPDTGQMPLASDGSLANQNFLVVGFAHTCPTDVAPDPATGDFVNSNTLEHRPYQ